jgi:hypothetical protein
MIDKSNSETPEIDKTTVGLEGVEHKQSKKKRVKFGKIIVPVSILIVAAKIGMFDNVSFNIEIRYLIGVLAALIVGTTFLWNRYGVVVGLISLGGAILYMVKFQ